MSENIILLGIETSCDDTAVAIIRDGKEILANEVISQAIHHSKEGGVIPEVASRLHVEQIIPALQKVFDQTKLLPQDMHAIAVTDGPGLIGSLLIGVMVAKTLSLVYELPLVPVNHILGHIYAAHLVKELTFPLVALVVSGGHTELLVMHKHGLIKRLGKTRDDAAGEAFDKVARMLGLPYPGGPPLEKLALNSKNPYCFPRAMLPQTPYHFSFSGLKTAVWQLLFKKDSSNIDKQDIAAGFQSAVVDVLVSKTMRAVDDIKAQRLLVVGGVAANSFLRSQMEEQCYLKGIDVTFPPPHLCTDNAAMIASAGTYIYRNGIKASLDLVPSSQRSFVDDYI